MTTIAPLAERLQALFSTTADDLGRRTGFVERASKLTGALFAQALVFGWLADPAASLPQVAAAAALAGVRITPQGHDQRCTSAAAGVLERLLSAAVAVLVQAEAVAIPLLERCTAVELLDASTIVLPDGLRRLLANQHRRLAEDPCPRRPLLGCPARPAAHRRADP